MIALKSFKTYFILFCFYSSGLFSQTWTSLGPNGGYFKDFVFHPANSQIVYAGSDDSGGIWKTTNGGTTWSLLTGNLPNFTGWKVVIDENHPNKIYGCDLYSRYGLIKSNDGGSTWQIINSGLTTKYDKMVTGLVIAHGKQDTLLISTGHDVTGTPPRPGNGIFKSFNGGVTWTSAGLQGTTTPCIASNGAGGAIFAGTRGHGLMVTTNFGASWINHPNIPTTYDVVEIETDSNIVMVSTGFNGVYLSNDYGVNFTNIGLVGEFNFDINIFRKVPTIELFSSALSGLKKYSSTTNSWTAVNHPELNNQLAMGIASKNNELYVSNFSNSNILKSNDGGINWNYIAQSPKATEIGGLFVDPSNTNHILTSLLGTYNIGGLAGKEAIRETNDGGINWANKGPVVHGRGIVKDNSTLNTFYLGTFANGLYKTVDAFTTFTNVRSGNKVIFDIAINPSNTQEILISELDVISSSYAILKSTNGGITFVPTSTLLATKLEYDPSNSSVVYASTFSGLVKSTNGGTTWNSFLFNAIPLSTLKPYVSHMYASLINGTLIKINGTSTVNITGPWPNNSQITNIIEQNGKLIIGINGAEKDTMNNLVGFTYLSVDSGTTWTNITGNMPCTHVYGMNALQAVNNDLYIGTYGGGVYKSLGLVTSIKEKLTRSSINIYPNPANDIITISNRTSLKVIEIYNSVGLLVLKTQLQHINITNLSTGFYYIKIFQNDNTFVEKRFIKQ